MVWLLPHRCTKAPTPAHTHTHTTHMYTHTHTTHLHTHMHKTVRQTHTHKHTHTERKVKHHGCHNHAFFSHPPTHSRQHLNTLSLVILCEATPPQHRQTHRCTDIYVQGNVYHISRDYGCYICSTDTYLDSHAVNTPFNNNKGRYNTENMTLDPKVFNGCDIYHCCLTTTYMVGHYEVKGMQGQTGKQTPLHHKYVCY